MKNVIEKIKARAKEPSTWAALAGVAASAGWPVAAAVCGALGVMMREGK